MCSLNFTYCILRVQKHICNIEVAKTGVLVLWHSVFLCRGTPLEKNVLAGCWGNVLLLFSSLTLYQIEIYAFYARTKFGVHTSTILHVEELKKCQRLFTDVVLLACWLVCEAKKVAATVIRHVVRQYIG